jgi:tight adherence protein C
VNLEFVIAVFFGVGVAGILTRYVAEPIFSLAARVGTKQQPVPAIGSKLVLGLWQQVMNKSHSLNTAKLNRALQELPEVIDLLVVSLRAGEGVYRSFANLVPRCDGVLSHELEKALRAVEFGAAFVNEIVRVSEALPNPQVKEFATKVALSLERGTPLARMLSEQSDSVRAEIKNQLLRQAGKNETRMLIPLVFLILPVTVLFAIYPSLELLNFGFM